MPEISNLASALAAFQAEVPRMSRDEKAKVKGETQDGRSYDRSYDYATLDQFVEIVEPVLGKHGLSVTSKTTFQDGRMVLEVSLLHVSGERETGYWPLPDPNGRGIGPQQLGSAMTYGRRYLGWALTGTFPGDVDDDGAKAQQSARESWDSARPRQEEKPAPVAEKDWSKANDDEIRQLHSKIEKMELGKAVNGYDWMAGKGLHERTIEVATDDGPVGITATELLAARLADEAVKSDADLAWVAMCRAYAEDRGLLKVAVSDSTTLYEELSMARDALIQQEVAQAKADTPNPQDA